MLARYPHDFSLGLGWVGERSKSSSSVLSMKHKWQATVPVVCSFSQRDPVFAMYQYEILLGFELADGESTGVKYIVVTGDHQFKCVPLL
jgi:hypothetical protein